MRQSRAHDHRAMLVIADLGTALVAFMVAGWIRFGSGFVSMWNADVRYPDVHILAPMLSLSIVTTFWAAGLYRGEDYLSLSREVADLVRGVGLSSIVLLAVLYMAKLQELSRLTLGLFFVLLLVGGAVTRMALLYARRSAPADGVVQVLLVGTDGAGRVIEAVRRAGKGVVGYVGRFSDGVVELARLGDLDELPKLLTKTVIDEVVVCLPVEEWGRLDAIAGVCAEQGKVMRVPVDVAKNTLRSARVEYLESIPLLTLVTTAGVRAGTVAKRAMDIISSAVLLVTLLPVLALIAITIRVVDGSPVIFGQVRGGLHGRPFRFYKFRTMEIDADSRKAEFADRNERQGPAFKMEDDPRVTRLGRTLRSTSIDELPQLWNVLKGDMSLVGPRPPTMDEVELYDPWHRRRLSVRPGITGMWQVTSRDDPSFDRWVDLDLQYIDTWSFWLDVKILARTPLALLRTPGS